MVDDSMEISSDRGGELGDDDIDIDIDITAGQIDEDDILDDATSNVDLAESPFPRPSSFVAVDDVMVDDDGTYAMDDGELFRNEQEQRMDDENIEMFFAPLDGSAFESNDEFFTGSAVVETSAPVVEGAWEPEGDGSNEDIDDTAGSPPNRTTIYHQAEGDVLAEKLEDKIVPAISNDYVNDIQGSTEHSSPTRSPRDPTQHDSATIPGPESARHSSSRHNSVHSDDAGDINAVATAQSETGNIESSVSSADFPVLPDVVVVYQSMEYALFGAADSEDPDSFFLADISIFDKPIADFFKAMRDVIHDDLSPEEELCLSVDDLGLEIEETVSPLHDITLAQISQTYEKLLHNDGVDMSRPLCLIVGTRPSFTKRLASLVACAAEGKGLSQVITLDGQPSGDFDEPSALKEDIHGETEVESSNGNINVDSNDQSIPNRTEDSQTNTPPTIADVDQELPEPNYNQQEEQQQQDDEANDHGSLTKDNQQQAAQIDNLLDTQKSPKHDPHSSEHLEEEEGDLIDYSEDEAHVEVEQRSPRSRITEATVNDNIANKEYETINGDLHQSPPSQLIDQIINEKTKEQATNHENEANGENTSQLDADVPYDLDNVGPWNDGDAVEYDNLSNEYMNSTAVDEADEELDESVADGDETQIIESSITTAAGAQPALDQEEYPIENDHPTIEAEHNPGDDANEQSEELFQDHSESWDISHHSGTGGDLNMGAADAANSSATLSADEHQDTPNVITGSVAHVDIATSPENGGETGLIPVEDEISYEDDEEEQDTNQINVPGTQEQFFANHGGPGKRTRAENDSDDSLSTREKDTKRHRS